MQKASDMNKTRRAESVRKIPAQRQRHQELISLKGGRNDNLQWHAEQIIQHLIKIIEVLLQEESSKNYIDFMKKTNEMF